MKKTILIILAMMLLSTGSFANATNPSNIYKEGLVEGYFIQSKDQHITVEEYGGEIYTIPMTMNIGLEIDGRPVKITDFKPGMEVYIELQGRSIKYMDAYSVHMPGYIPPGGKTRIGTIKNIDRDQIKIISPTGREEIYFTSPATIIMKDKTNIATNALYIGDRVKLYFDDINASYISRLEIEGSSILIKDLYRGKITLVDKLQDLIALEEVEVFTNGSWKRKDKNLKLPYNGDLPIYIGGQKIDSGNLKYYKGKTAYMAMKDNFGKEQIERMLVKSQYESNFSDKIKDVSTISSQIKLANNKNIDLKEGTMIIKSGRLVDTFSLNAGSDGLIIADGRGADLSANIIYIYNEEINNSNIGQEHIYAGRLNTILQDRVYLKDFFLLDNHDWESFPEEKELFYDDDTFIYDSENDALVSNKEFFSSGFSVDESRTKNEKPRDWYGYIYTDGDRIAAAYVKRSIDSLLVQRTTVGIVETLPAENEKLRAVTFKLKDAKDWSYSWKQWMERNSSLNINLKETMIIKNGQRVEVDEIKLGDRLYLVRDSNMAKVIIIK